MQHDFMDDEVTDAEVSAVEAECEMWELFLEQRCEAAGAAVALSALWTLGDMMKDGLMPKAN